MKETEGNRLGFGSGMGLPSSGDNANKTDIDRRQKYGKKNRIDFRGIDLHVALI